MIASQAMDGEVRADPEHLVRLAKATLAASAVLALLLAGCGGGGSTGPKATLKAALTRTASVLSWQWTLRNDDKVPVVVLDGPVDGTTAQPQAWITPGDDDSVEVAYRFLAPPDGVDVTRPVLQAGQTVAPGASASGTTRVALPLAVRHPYAGDFSPPLSLPPGTPEVRFCVGVVNANDVRPQPGGSYAHVASAVAGQRLVCTD